MESAFIPSVGIAAEESCKIVKATGSRVGEAMSCEYSKNHKPIPCQVGWFGISTHEMTFEGNVPVIRYLAVDINDMRGNDIEDWVRINYCPMCGEKL